MTLYNHRLWTLFRTWRRVSCPAEQGRHHGTTLGLKLHGSQATQEMQVCRWSPPRRKVCRTYDTTRYQIIATPRRPSPETLYNLLECLFSSDPLRTSVASASEHVGSPAMFGPLLSPFGNKLWSGGG